MKNLEAGGFAHELSVLNQDPDGWLIEADAAVTADLAVTAGFGLSKVGIANIPS